MRRNSKSSVLFLGWIFLIPICCPASGQSNTGCRISGRVTDGAARLPVYFANVFLANTTRGAATEEDGNYTIDFIPPGSYKLVVRMMGYESKSIDVTLKQGEELHQDFTIYPVPITAPELRVSAATPREWRRNLQKFKRLFLGVSNYALKCRILNEEILDFDTRKDGVFKATARKPLEIENLDLGYQITFYLEEFVYLEGSLLRYLGEAQFKPMSAESERDLRRWQNNRRKVYYGSMRHFLASAFKGTANRDGYLVFNVKDLEKEDEYIHLKAVIMDTLFLAGNSGFQKVLAFDDYLKIVYTEESHQEKDDGFGLSPTMMHRQGKTTQYQTSGLKLNVDNVTINALGNLHNPYALTSYGHWAIEDKFAEMLPLDYIP